MTPQEDRILQILRTLKPPPAAGAPEGASPGAAPRAPAPPSTDAAARAPVPATPVPWNVTAPPATRGPSPGRIEVRLEEAGLFFLAAVLLVVLAFLMGWYGRGLAGGGARPATAQGDAPCAPRVSLAPMDSAAAIDLGERVPAVRAATAGAPQAFSILVARFPAGGEAEAEDHRKFLEQNGFVPAWIRRTTAGVELCVGHLAAPTDVLAREWLPKLRALHGSYAASRVVRIPQE